MYYLAKVHGRQSLIGDNYNNLCQSISITLTTERLFPSLEGAFQSFYLTSKTDPKVTLTANVQFHFLFLSKNLNNHITGLNKGLVDWMKFFNIPNISEAEMIKILSSNNMISKAWEETRNLSRTVVSKLFLKPKRKRIETESLDTTPSKKELLLVSK